MNTKVNRLLALILVAMPMMAAAQNNIKAAFDAIIKCPQAQITESHSLERDPATGMKIGQSDVYRFVLPADKANLVRKVEAAFEKDTETAYSFNSGRKASGDSDLSLAVGNDDGNGVKLTNADCDYTYSLFLAPQAEDPDGIHRYAYAISYKNEDGKIEGKLVVTYATTLKYRLQAARENQNRVIRGFSNGAYVIPSKQSWFDTLMSYFQSMTKADSQTRIALASKAYKVIRDTSNYTDVTESDKKAVSEILKGMISDKKYSETVLNNLLNQCLAGIK